MRRLVVLLALFLPVTALAQTLPGSPFSGSGGGGGAAFNGGDVTGQTNVCGPSNPTNVEIGSCSADADGGTGGTSTVIGNGAANSGDSTGVVAIGSTAVVSGTTSTNSIVIGNAAVKNGNSGQAHIVIGPSISDSSTGNNVIAIGNTAGATGTAANSIILGATATTALSNVFIAGTTGGFEINKVMFRGTAPAVSACGTSPSVATGSATSGFLTTGSGAAATSCTITFPTAYTTAPSCICNNEGALSNIRAVTTTTTLTCSVASAADLVSVKINWLCLGGA